jgi:hypothetical protein
MTDKPIVQVDVPQDVLAKEFCDRGSQFLRAFELLNQHGENKVVYPQFYALSHAVELLLKSYLLSDGATYLEITNLGHDHAKAYAACCARKFPTIDNLDHLIRWLVDLNHDHELRYPENMEGEFPHPDECLAVAADLEKLARSRVVVFGVLAEVGLAADHRGKEVRYKRYNPKGKRA